MSEVHTLVAQLARLDTYKPLKKIETLAKQDPFIQDKLMFTLANRRTQHPL